MCGQGARTRLCVRRLADGGEDGGEAALLRTPGRMSCVRKGPVRLGCGGNIQAIGTKGHRQRRLLSFQGPSPSVPEARWYRAHIRCSNLPHAGRRWDHFGQISDPRITERFHGSEREFR